MVRVLSLLLATVPLCSSLRMHGTPSFVSTGGISSGSMFKTRYNRLSGASHGPASVRMMQGGAAAQQYDGARIGPPPDLPSLLLHNRIVYMGMPLVAAVTELMVAQLLYLQYENPEKPVFMYINSPGTSSPDGNNVGFETEAFAIADTMAYIKPEIQTICIGQAFGTAAMILSSGAKGKRSCLPNSTIMLHQPRSQTRGQASDIAIKAREVLHNREVLFQMIADNTGLDYERVAADAARTRYLNANDALEYGLVDRVLESTSELPASPSFMSNL